MDLTGYISIVVIMLIMVMICTILLTFALSDVKSREHLDGVAKTGFDLLVTAVVFAYVLFIIFIALIAYSSSYIVETKGSIISKTIALGCLISMIVITVAFTFITCFATYYISKDSGSKDTLNYCIASSVLFSLTVLLGIGGAIYIGIDNEKTLSALKV